MTALCVEGIYTYMATTSSDIQALIDAKVALIQQIISNLADLLASPKPSYSIDGQSVSWSEYQSNLVDMQVREVACLKLLYELQNIIQPYQFQSTANAGSFGAYGYGW